jgi:predicted GIY-YIG superfamily endonuclease
MTDRPTIDRSPIMSRRKKQSGFVYLIHFRTRLHHAGHYLGYCDDLGRRIAQHQSGNGARLMEVLKQCGIKWKLVRVWLGDRRLERRLKRRKNTPRQLCPVCRGEVTYGEVNERDVLPSAGVGYQLVPDPEDLPF